MPFAGKQLTIKQALALCWVVGFRGHPHVRAVAVMWAESDRYEGAYHDNDDGSRDRGLFQINSIHTSLSDADAYRAVPNATFAFNLSQGGTDWTPWAAFNSLRYKVFVPLVYAVKVLGTWKTRESQYE
jgi:hypothetical protein